MNRCWALISMTGPYLADWNETHIYNPRWPPHARFHNEQTLALASVAGALCLWFLWRRGGEARTNLMSASLFVSLYFVTQLAALLYPGVELFDPGYPSPIPTLAGFRLTQPRGASLMLVLISVGFFLERRLLETPGGQPTGEQHSSGGRGAR
jgi:hypothetical protein